MNYRKIAVVAACVAVAVGALLAVLIILGIAGYGPRAPRTEVTEQRPYADYVGREIRIVGDISATAWNDFPDRAKILSVTLDPPPRTRNRFVSYVIPMKRGQRVRVLKAWREYSLFEIFRRYVVSVPDAGLPTDVEITMSVGANGLPDPRYYEPIN